MRGELGTAGAKATGRGKPRTGVAAGQGEAGVSGVASGKRQEAVRKRREKAAKNHQEEQPKSSEKSRRKAAEKQQKIAAKKRQKIAAKKVAKKQRKTLQIENLPVIRYFVANRVAPRCKKIVCLIVRSTTF
ncbi:hypothetical protein TURU_099581 [Turdus rufiventris]|nr:hypothetical protein TURU_099581 [Turdus rufiventris]